MTDYTWKQIYWQLKAYPHAEPLRLPAIESSVFALRARCFGGQRSWRRAGWLCPVFQIPPMGESEGKWERVYFGISTRRTEVLNASGYLFRAVGWLPDVEITVWEPDPPLSEILDPVSNQLLTRLDEKLTLLLNEF